MYRQTTDYISVKVEPLYLEDESCPDDGFYVWSYHVMIENKGDEAVQLCTRHWKITDHYGFSQEVIGEGVIGEQPVLLPGEAYEYTSGTPLNAPGGIMVGSYTMRRPNGDKFTVGIPAFSLDSPYQPVSVN